MGVDSSTQSTKIEVRDADDGRLIADGRAPHPPTRPPRSEHDPEAWWDALVIAVGMTGIRDIAALSVAGQQHGLVALHKAGVVQPDAGRTVLVGGGARSPAYRQIVAHLSGLTITVPDGDEHVATGACIQAAAVLHGCPPDEVADAWKLGAGREVEPDPRVDRDALRARFAAIRDRSA